LVKTDVSEERVASIFSVREKTREIRESEVTVRSGKNSLFLPLRTVTSLSRISRVFSLTLKMEATRSSETSVLTNYTRRKIPEDGLLQIIK
jgi:hypothetical protein